MVIKTVLRIVIANKAVNKYLKMFSFSLNLDKSSIFILIFSRSIVSKTLTNLLIFSINL